MATAPALKPLPPANLPLASSDPKSSGQPSQGMGQWMGAVDNYLRTGNMPALSVNGNNVLTVAGNQTLAGGFNETPFPLGTPTNGSTITPNPSDNLKQTLTNNVAGFTIAATAQVGDIEIYVTNGASAGAITLSGFTKQLLGDAFDTINGHEFVIFIYGFKNAAGVVKTAVLVKAMQ
jgi:hypothetical protein